MSVAGIKDPNTQEAIRQMGQEIDSLRRQVTELTVAVKELQNG